MPGRGYVAVLHHMQRKLRRALCCLLLPGKASHALGTASLRCAGAGMARSKEWWKTLLGMLMQQRLVRSEARQGGMGSFSAVALTPEARPGAPLCQGGRAAAARSQCAQGCAPLQLRAPWLCACQGAAFLARPAPRELVLPLPKELVAEERRGELGAAGAPATPAPPADDAAAREEEARLFQTLVALRRVRRRCHF